jgi:co-chaperonin GroES (HSP10)
MTITPILHRILVKPDVLEEVDETFKAAKQAGIVFDFMERDREQAAIDTGVVLDFGPTAFKDFGADNPLAVGVRVVYAKYGGKAIVDPATKIRYVLLNDEDVIAIIKEGA